MYPKFLKKEWVYFYVMKDASGKWGAGDRRTRMKWAALRWDKVNGRIAVGKWILNRFAVTIA